MTIILFFLLLFLLLPDVGVVVAVVVTFQSCKGSRESKIHRARRRKWPGKKTRDVKRSAGRCKARLCLCIRRVSNEK